MTGKTKKTSLEKYHKRRHFGRTPEPKGTIKKKKAKELLFVVHKHDASHLHYDLRLEIEGVLVSWAIPKGFSLNPEIKHLAIQTEDHPYEYAQFEGIIPEGEYGGGTVMIWDIGTYHNLRKTSLSQSLRQGTLEVWIKGSKLQGGFALIRMKHFAASSNKTQWLVIKMDDEYADRRRTTFSEKFQRSARSGRTMREIEREEKARD